jgi:hypothetical protein
VGPGADWRALAEEGRGSGRRRKPGVIARRSGINCEDELGERDFRSLFMYRLKECIFPRLFPLSLSMRSRRIKRKEKGYDPLSITKKKKMVLSERGKTWLKNLPIFRQRWISPFSFFFSVPIKGTNVLAHHGTLSLRLLGSRGGFYCCERGRKERGRTCDNSSSHDQLLSHTLPLFYLFASALD